MRGAGKSIRMERVLFSIRRYCIIFLSMSFVITCCMLLFLHSMGMAMGERGLMGREEIELAAKLTFANIMVLSFLCTVVDRIQRQFTVELPVKRIVSATDRMMSGDLSVRIQPIPGLDEQDGFNIVIDRFNRMAEELSGIETLRTDFIADVSHELKTPLAVIQNYATMLQQPGLSEEKRLAYAKSIAGASRGLADLVSNILRLNKLENQKIFPNVEVYDLGEQLCACLLSFEEAWEEKRLAIETQLEEGVFVRTDAQMLTLVWNNLFSNAIKFTDADGRISLSLRTEGGCAVVQVADTGCGISPEVGRHIFEKFYQGDASRVTQGNGLGLALVKRVIDIIGGDISVESETGRGSTFTVRLRRCEDGTIQGVST